jgi:N-acetylglucosaminyldiphosphoundecaprenol N-acetyl-beta-D-mannosaminyltransferase
MKNFPTVGLSGYSILNTELDLVEFDSKCIINTVNQYSFTLAESDLEFKTALSKSDILLPDGIGIVAAVKIISHETIKKIAGADMHLHLLQKLNREGGSCFYLGSTRSTLSKIKKKINNEFPNIRTKVHSPSFNAFFANEENEQIINMINEFKPDVLFVGMTAPKQEKWTYRNQEQINANIICSIGAVFDFYAETTSRPAKFWQSLGLEWFIRLLNEPRRMAKRYLYYGPIFCYLVFIKKLGAKEEKKTVDNKHIQMV